MEGLFQSSINAYYNTINQAQSYVQYIKGMTYTGIQAYNNHKLVSFMISLPIIGRFFRTAIIFYCKSLGYHPFVHILSVGAHLRKCPLTSFTLGQRAVSVCYCPLSVVRLLLKDIGRPYAPLTAGLEFLLSATWQASSQRVDARTQRVV